MFHGQTSNKPYYLIFGLSLVIHLSLLLIYLEFHDVVEQKTSNTYKVSLVLAPVIEEPPSPQETPAVAQPIPKLPELTKPKIDQFDPSLLIKQHSFGEKDLSTNTSDITANELDYGVNQGSKKKVEGKKGAEEHSEIRDIVTTVEPTARVAAVSTGEEEQNQVEGGSGIDELESIESNQSDGHLDNTWVEAVSEVRDELEIPAEFLGLLGNMTQLSEIDLGNAFVKEPFSENKGKEVRLVNKVFERMAAQVVAVFVPSTQIGACKSQGKILLAFSPYGQLEKAKLSRSCGHTGTDVAWFDALKRVGQFDMHANPEINKKYFSNLSIHYGGSIPGNFELLPYEQELLGKK